MSDAVIVSTARTGLAKSWRGAFNMTHGATMGGHVVRAAMARAKVDPAAAGGFARSSAIASCPRARPINAAAVKVFALITIQPRYGPFSTASVPPVAEHYRFV